MTTVITPESESSITYREVEHALKGMSMKTSGLQTTQPTSGGAVTAVTNCCANCVVPSLPQQWGTDLPFFGASRPCGPAGWLTLLLTKAGDVETNPGPKT